jgi:hypothetical protein
MAEKVNPSLRQDHGQRPAKTAKSPEALSDSTVSDCSPNMLKGLLTWAAA